MEKMKKTVSEVSKQLGISKDTLRYYDQIELVKPLRKENNYRFYSEKEIQDLKYIQVLKFGGFSLMDIQQIMKNKNCSGKDMHALKETMKIMEYKEKDLKQRIEQYTQIVSLMKETRDSLAKKIKNKDKQEIDEMVNEIYLLIEGKD